MATIQATETKTDTTRTSTSLVVKATTLAFLIAPPLAIITVAAFALAPTWTDLALAAILYTASMAGVTIGFHRLLTHKGFRATPALRTVLVASGCLSLQGSPIGWVATHRKHHQLSDRDGDPHSPHTEGAGPARVLRGFWHAHAGWLFDGEDANVQHYAPDMLQDRVVVNVDRLWYLIAATGMFLIPGIVGYLTGGDWVSALTCILWAGIIRVGLAHHTAWSVNSICHLWGKRPFRSHDQSTNVAWLAPFVMGESFHNAHHAYPASPRHGLLPHQWDPSARLIRWFEILGWATNVKWYTPEQVRRKMIDPPA